MTLKPKQRKPDTSRGKVIFLKRFFKNPARVAYILPSSKNLIKHVVGEMDLKVPRVIAEFGPGEGCHTREILRKAHPETRLFLFELDTELARFLEQQFADEPRVTVLNTNCCNIKQVMTDHQIPAFDYVFSGIPFSLMDKPTKAQLMRDIYDSLHPNSSFIIYQVTNELVRYGNHFDHTRTKRVLLNIPPMVVTVYHKNGKTP